MKCLNLIALILATGLLPRLSAADALKLELELYVFLDAEFARISLDTGAAVPPERGEVFSAPTWLKFDDHVLRLADGVRIWDEEGKPAPPRFSPVSMPTLVVAPLQQASVLCAMPLQYMEKMPDGSLQVRRIAGDSPEAPRYRLTFQTSLPDDADKTLVSCQLEVVTVSGREKIPGIDLDVGKPIMARFDEKFQLSARTGSWSGFLLRRPRGGDYGLLLLLKVTPQPGGGAVPVTGAMSEEELDRFVSHYYRHPQPAEVERAIEGVGVAGGEFLRGRDYMFVGFFAEVFASNPERVAGWRKVIGRQNGAVRSLFRPALRLGKPGALLAQHERSVQSSSMYWGGFCATGNPAYLRKLTDMLVLLDSERVELFSAGSAAMRLLSWQASQHPLVRTTLKAFMVESGPRLGSYIGNVLEKEPLAIHEQLIALRLSRKFRETSGLKPGPGITGPPDNLAVGADAGRAPPSSSWVPTPIPFTRN